MAKEARGIPWLDTIEGVYYVFWYDAERRRTRRLSLGTKEAGQAQARYAAFLVEHGGVEGVLVVGSPAKVACAVVLDDYLREHVNVKCADPARQRIAIGYLCAHFGALPFGAIENDTTVHGNAGYCAKRRAGSLGWTDERGKARGNKKALDSGTLRRELNVLVAAINRYLRVKKLPNTLAPYIDLPADSLPKERWLTQAELAQLFSACSGRTLRFARLAYYTAGRRTAIETLTKFQVDLERRRINLNPAGRRQTKKRRPVVPIFDEILPDLRAAMKEPGEYVLGSGGAVRKSFEAAAKRAGLAGVSPHTLRHTRATHLLRAGVAPWKVAGLLGDTLDTVMKTYGHHCPDDIREAVGLSESLGVAPKNAV